MTPKERQQSLNAARQACEWLSEYYFHPQHAEEVRCLIFEFARLADKEQAQAEAGRKYGIRGGRPKKAATKKWSKQ